MDLPFETLDVFTDRTFGGNPLGVFPDAAHLPTDVLQRIALEMHLSETVFLGPPERGGTARVRIFTPAKELPFAGHPTVGTAMWLVARGHGGGYEPGRGVGGAPGGAGSTPESPGSTPGGAGSTPASGGSAPPDGEIAVVLEEGVGPVPVVVRVEGGRPVFARFTTAILPEHRPAPHSPAELAAMVGLDADDVLDGSVAVGAAGYRLAPELVSCGVPYYCIPVRSIDAVRRSALDHALWKSMGVATGWADHVYVLCMDGEGEGVDVRVRMYAPGSGVPEDPATGSAAAALGGYLSAADGRPEARLSWTVEQGLEMGRPSLIRVEADRAGGRTTAVRVGGSAVFVSRGVMTVPEVA